jgi:hypothetical protein
MFLPSLFPKNERDRSPAGAVARSVAERPESRTRFTLSFLQSIGRGGLGQSFELWRFCERFIPTSQSPF